jgi:Pyruvate/2-oxoacid:ferredoxin oxidoreductase delta subunit
MIGLRFEPACARKRKPVNKTPRILYCHCAHAEILPAETRRQVLEALAARGADVEVVPDLCELSAHKDPLLKRLAEQGEVQVIACHPRAVRWLFSAAGAPLPAEAIVYNMRTQDAGAIVAHLAGTVAVPATAKHSALAIAPKAPGAWVPWFPVIDYERCVNCRQCLQFCLFSVYSADSDGKVRVVKPEKCKTNCPACARICPQAAIIFPKFAEGGPISGDDSPVPKDAPPPVDFSSLAGLDFHEALRRRSALMRQRDKGGKP